jgi:hypothetical protein
MGVSTSGPADFSAFIETKAARLKKLTDLDEQAIAR